MATGSYDPDDDDPFADRQNYLGNMQRMQAQMQPRPQYSQPVSGPRMAPKAPPSGANAPPHFYAFNRPVTDQQ